MIIFLRGSQRLLRLPIRFSIGTEIALKIISSDYRCGLHFVHGLQYCRTKLSFTGILEFCISRQQAR
jgi:hypothetical protein